MQYLGEEYGPLLNGMRDRRAEALLLAHRSAERLAKGKNTPSDIKRLCMTIRVCGSALECTCLDLDPPVRYRTPPPPSFSLYSQSITIPFIWMLWSILPLLVSLPQLCCLSA